ncbi:cysteine proteinase inhibitor 8-like [Curcuma longa]|uniref:cysteine proteinase inhibitor 8-like n=1 Tax=Curcuma longa TaxID=136217 RepID=UPI003D9E9FFB
MITMTPRSTRLSPLLLFLLFLAVPATARRIGIGGWVGGWAPIKDVEDSHVRELGEFAVEEHNRREHGQVLAFDKVVRGETQVVAGINYRLVLRTREAGGSPAHYQAVVWEKVWINFKQLTSFVPIES